MRANQSKVGRVIFLITICLIGHGVRAQAPSWSVEPSAFEHSMTITGIVYLDDTPVANTDAVLGAFVGTEVRGVASPIYIASIDTYIFFLSVFSNEFSNEQITFSLYDPAQGAAVELTNTLDFESDQVLGTISEPIVLEDGFIHSLTMNEISDQEVNELEQLSFTVGATHSDAEASFSFSLDANSTTKGMLIDATTGIFTWIPDEEQDGDHEVTITVGDGELEDSKLLHITVTEVNLPPVLNLIGAQTTDEGTELSFVITASDADLPAPTLTFLIDETSITNGMIIDSSTGTFSWTPTEEQDGDHEVTFTVSDGELTDLEVVTITVNEINRTPVIEPIEDQEVVELELLSFFITASDPDIPVQELNFTLDVPSLVKGMSIDVLTGNFIWIPKEGDNGEHAVTVTVMDREGGISNEQFLISVNEQMVVGFNDSEDAFHIYPNPTSDLLKMTTPFKGQVSIFDVTGKEVLTIHAAEKISSIDLNALQANRYLIRFRNTAGAISTFRLVKE
ncbi:MAG: putative Ig domain-containing protein [Cyclobacteriaceae bacterium]